MEPIPYRFELNDRVVIKPDMTHMYPYARVYSEGEVMGRKRDQYGYPVILVKWDKDHWAYSGEMDGWFLQAHFDPAKVKETKMGKSDKQEAFESLQDQILGMLAAFAEEHGLEEEFEPEDEVQEEPKKDGRDRYARSLERAMRVAQEAQGFILIAAVEHSTGEGDDDRVLIQPMVAEEARSERAKLLLHAALSDLAAQTHLADVYTLLAKDNDDD